MASSRKIKKYNLNRKKENRVSFCLAPFNAMHFSFGGIVYPCHNNNSLAYGDLKHNSLKEIWDGQTRLFYQKKLRKNKLTKTGCLQCLHDIDRENYHAVNAMRYDAYDFDKNKRYPDIIGFRFSDKCNIQCIMCFSNHLVRNSENNENDIYNDAFFEDLNEFIPHVKYAYFSGGEPFFEKLNYRVFDLFAELNPECRISVQTNGMILNEEVRKYLVKGKFDINVSIDSLIPETFESIRKGADFHKVMSNILEFKDYCESKGTNFSSCITPMRMNYSDIHDIINFYNKHDVKIWINKYYFPSKYAIWSLSSNEIFKIINELQESKIEIYGTASENNLTQYQSFGSLLKSYYESAKLRENEKLNFDKLSLSLIKLCKKNLKSHKAITNNKYDKAIELLNNLEESNKKKLYYYLKYLTDVFSGDKLAENLTLMNKEFVNQDIESVSV